MNLYLPLLFMLAIASANSYPLRVTIEGGQAMVVLYYGNGTFITLNGNTTVYLPNGTVRAEVIPFQPFSSVLINGVPGQNLTFTAGEVGHLNVTLVPLEYTLTVRVVGNGTVRVGFGNSTEVKVYSQTSFRMREGQMVYLDAQPLPGYRFLTWSDNVTSPQRWVLVYNVTNLTAVFVKAPSRGGFQGLNLTGVGVLLTVGGVYWMFRRR